MYASRHSSDRSAYRPSPHPRPGRDWDVWDDYWADRKFQMSRSVSPHDFRTVRRYNYLDPPYALWWKYPTATAYPNKGNRQDLADRVDQAYRSHDQAISRPQNAVSQGNVGKLEPRRVLQMYRQGLIDYDGLQKSWLGPFSLERKTNEFQAELEKKEKVDVQKRNWIPRSNSTGWIH